MKDATALLSEMLQLSRVPDSKKTSKTFREKDAVFVEKPDQEIPPGVLNFSPSWFPRGHGVSLIYRTLAKANDILQKGYNGTKENLVPSVSIRDDKCRDWIRKSSEFEWMVNLLLMWFAPDMHEQAAKSTEASKHDQDDLQPPYLQNVKDWPSVFSALTVISNRKTESHLDKGSYDSAFDILLSGGDYSDCKFKVENTVIDAEFLYDPGTLIAVLGRVLHHGVPDWAGDDRICYAHYVKDDIHLKHECRRSTWVEMASFENMMGEHFKKGLRESSVKVSAV